MKFLISLFCFLGITAFFGVAQQQPQADECKFNVTGEPARATVTGPDDLVPLVYVVEQPDSPLEILSIDLTGMWLSVSKERYTYHNCKRITVRNRSDRTILRYMVSVGMNHVPGPGIPGDGASPLAPNQTTEIGTCNGGGDGDAPGNHIRLVVAVTAADFGDFVYHPSLRIPRSLGIYPLW